MGERHPQITYAEHKDFIGLGNFLESNNTGPKYVYYGKNVQFDRGKIISSPGHSPYLPLSTGGTDYQCMAKFQDITLGGSGKEYLAVLYNEQWSLIDPSADSKADVGSAVGFDERTDAQQYYTSLYAVSPNVGGVKINTSGATVIPTIPPGSMIAFAWEKMWVTGVPGYEATLYGSRTATASNPAYVEDFATGAQTELVGKGGKNTALRFLNDTLYIFKKNSIHQVKPDYLDATTTLYIPKPFSEVCGAVSQWATCQVENDIWFLTQDNEVRSLGAAASYNDPRTRDISAIIRDIKDNLEIDQTNFAVMHYSNGVFTLALAEKGSPCANIVITYNFINKGFGIDRFPSVKLWQDVAGRVFMATVNSGQLYLDRTGYSFGDTAIPFEVRLPFDDLGYPDKDKRMRRFFIRGNRSRGVALTLRVYKGNYQTYDDYVLPEPDSAELGTTATQTNPFGKNPFGKVAFGGITGVVSDKPSVYRFEKHISATGNSNMFAIGILAELNGQRLEIDTVKLGILPGSRQPFNI